MKKTGIFFGSTTGTTRRMAEAIAERLGIGPEDIHNVAETPAGKAGEYEALILGSSTWGSGDLQDDWYAFLPELCKTDLKGKPVALFGCGDGMCYSDTFCNAIGTLREDLSGTGCRFIGETDASDYTFDSSSACIDGTFAGLALDASNDSALEGRIDAWTDALKPELA